MRSTWETLGVIVVELKVDKQCGALVDYTTRRNQKKKRELVPLVVGSYFTHGPSNVAYMQIVKSNSNGRPRTSITRECNLPLYSSD